MAYNTVQTYMMRIEKLCLSQTNMYVIFEKDNFSNQVGVIQMHLYTRTLICLRHSTLKVKVTIIDLASFY